MKIMIFIRFFVAMLLSAVAINSFAYQVGEIINGDNLSAEYHGFKFKILTLGTNASVGVSSISRTGDVVIPSEVNDGKGLTFTVFRLQCGGSESITSITLPNTIQRIESVNAFPGVTTFRIPASVTYIDPSFYYGVSPNLWDKLESWEVEDGNADFAAENGILYSKDMKTLISIPRNKNYVSSDGSYTVRDGVETIQYVSTSPVGTPFNYNNYQDNLKKLILPASLESFNYRLRDALDKLEAFEVKEGNPYLKDDGNGVLLTADGTKLLLYPLGKEDASYKVPDGVTTIEGQCFKNSKFSTLDLNDVTVLNSLALCNCVRITELDLRNVVTLKTNCINTCTNLTTITIPATLTEIEDGAFVSCTRLQNYIVEEGNPNYYSHDGVLYTADKKTLLYYPIGKSGSTYIIPEEFGVTEIASSAFYSAKITSITIPSTVVTIGDNAFNASKIQTVNIETPSSLKEIKERAFQSTSSLKSFTWPEGVDAIPDNCFNSSGLESIEIPDNVKAIGKMAFYASKIKTVKIGKGVTSIGDFAFRFSELSEVIFDEKSNVTSIGFTAFGSTKLNSFTLPTSLKVLSINTNPIFDKCNQLTEIIVPDGSVLTTIEKFGAPNLEKFTFEGSSNVTTIGSEAFKNHKNLTELHFPNSVKTLGYEAFMGCTNLESVTFEGGEAEITLINTAAFADCGLKSFDVPNKVKTIGNEAFRNCDVMTTVSLPAVTTSVDPQAFAGCKALTTINVDKENQTYSSSDGILLTKNKETLVIFPMGKANSNFTLLPPSITKIGNYAFYDNENLTNVTIPNKVTTIGNRAFGLCKNLNTVTFLCDNIIDPDNIAQARNVMAFDDGTQAPDMFGNITIYVRQNLATQYTASEYYQKFKGIETSFIDETSRAGGLNKTNAKEEFIAVSDNTVDLLSVDTNDETYVLPTTVKQGDKTYNVSLVGDYLFTANGSSVPNVKEVVVPGDVKYIGARAFLTYGVQTSTISTVESVFLIGDQLNEDLLSTARFELTPEDLGSGNKKRYDEFGTTTKIYVRKSAEDTYKTAWTNYADNISYKIPYTQSGTFGTFAREFDVDFSEVNGVNEENPVTDDPVVIAFTGDGKYNVRGDSYYVHMTSINLGDQTGKDGTYVPAGSGVLIKKYKDADLYYQIAETGVSEAFVEGNFMKGVTLRKETIETADGVSRFYISGGVLHEMTQPKQFGNHKSYMEISNDDIPAGAKVMLSFVDMDEGTTGIDGMMTDENADDANKVYYNLNGQRVNTPSKGIYIVNGKKVIVK